MIITVTKDSAELLAQIFPTLLIALAIEIRGKKGQFKTFLGLVRFGTRVVAILTSLVATFLCILIVTGSPIGAATNWWVTLAFWSLFAALLLFVSNLFHQEIDES